MMDRIQKVKTIVREWLLEHSEVLVAQGVQMEMVADNKDYLRIILETTIEWEKSSWRMLVLLRTDSLNSKLLKSLMTGLKL